MLVTHSELQTPIGFATAAPLTTPDVISTALPGNPVGPLFIESIPLSGHHCTPGHKFPLVPHQGYFHLLGCLPSTPTVHISHWHSQAQFPYILPVHVIHILTLTNFEQIIATLHSPKSITCGVCLPFDAIRNNLSEPGLPQFYFDQLRVIQHINASLCQSSQAYTVTP